VPLLDHFRPPLAPDHQWESFHSAWPTLMTQQLNHGLLPPGYFAAPHTQLGAEVEIDAATFEVAAAATGNGGGVATAVYASPQPRLTRPLRFRQPDLFEVQVLKKEGKARLVAAVELVSPSNKDRPAHRQAFILKCVSYLQQGISVIMVDIVTERHGSLHADLLGFLEVEEDPDLLGPNQLFAAAYRSSRAPDGRARLEAWPEALRVGASLLTLPLWLDAGLAVPLDLEQSYLATCDLLLLRG
jgi:hypothetical protein